MSDGLDVVDPKHLHEELAETRRRLAELKAQAKREAQARKRSAIEDPEKCDWVWGAPAIGKLIGRSPNQVYYLFGCRRDDGKPYFGDAVWKFSHKHLVASRAKLTALANKLASET
jgi:hypothetical protein